MIRYYVRAYDNEAQARAKKPVWEKVFEPGDPRHVSDPWTRAEAHRQILTHGRRFPIVTIEHERY
jgi:hypothetical protein